MHDAGGALALLRAALSALAGLEVAGCAGAAEAALLAAGDEADDVRRSAFTVLARWAAGAGAGAGALAEEVREAALRAVETENDAGVCAAAARALGAACASPDREATRALLQVLLRRDTAHGAAHKAGRAWDRERAEFGLAGAGGGAPTLCAGGADAGWALSEAALDALARAAGAEGLPTAGGEARPPPPSLPY
jgi:hypothetical protein